LHFCSYRKYWIYLKAHIYILYYRKISLKDIMMTNKKHLKKKIVFLDSILSQLSYLFLCYAFSFSSNIFSLSTRWKKFSFYTVYTELDRKCQQYTSIFYIAIWKLHGDIFYWFLCNLCFIHRKIDGIDSFRNHIFLLL
jgi:hypothetical protein